MARLFEIGSRYFSTTPFGPLIWAPQQRFRWRHPLVSRVCPCFPVEFIMKWVWVNTYRYNLLVGWTSIYQLFWGSVGTRVLTHPQVFVVVAPSVHVSVDLEGYQLLLHFWRSQPQPPSVVHPIVASCFFEVEEPPKWSQTIQTVKSGTIIHYLVCHIKNAQILWIFRFSGY